MGEREQTVLVTHTHPTPSILLSTPLTLFSELGEVIYLERERNRAQLPRFRQHALHTPNRILSKENTHLRKARATEAERQNHGTFNGLDKVAFFNLL